MSLGEATERSDTVVCRFTTVRGGVESSVNLIRFNGTAVRISSAVRFHRAETSPSFRITHSPSGLSTS